MSKHGWQRLILMCLLLATLTACSSEDSALLSAFFDEWLRSKGMNPKNDKGQVDAWGAIETVWNVGRRAATGSTGDQQADGALGIFEVIDPIRTTENLTNQGIDTGDQSKIDEAIKQRPNDYHQRNALAVLQMAQGNFSQANETLEAAEAAYQRANPNSGTESQTRILRGDRLSLLDRAIKNEDKNGATSEGKRQMRVDYCNLARNMKSAYGNSFWLDRNKKGMRFSCDQY